MFLPLTIEATVPDDCGDPVATGSVVARFSNGDLQVRLVSIGGGQWVGTWQPRAPSAGGLITLFGERLADRKAVAPAVPIPTGVPPGDAVPAVVTVAGQPSMPVTVAVR